METVAIGLGRLMIKAQSLPLNVDAVTSWKQELDTLVLGTDQLDLHAILLANNSTFGTLTSENCEDCLKHYTDLIDCMRQQLYRLKAVNRSILAKRQSLRLGDYEVLLSERVLFRGKEITFGGKLRRILMAFLVDNDEHTLTAAKITKIWGDDNIAAAPRHRDKLEKALAPYYGDGHKHINRIQTNPTTYKLDIV